MVSCGFYMGLGVSLTLSDEEHGFLIKNDKKDNEKTRKCVVLGLSTYYEANVEADHAGIAVGYT